jgi:hypothetical protein
MDGLEILIAQVVIFRAILVSWDSLYITIISSIISILESLPMHSKSAQVYKWKNPKHYSHTRGSPGVRVSARTHERENAHHHGHTRGSPVYGESARIHERENAHHHDHTRGSFRVRESARIYEQENAHHYGHIRGSFCVWRKRVGL